MENLPGTYELPKSDDDVLLVSGFWGQNIGNAFFNLGGLHFLKQIFPENHVKYTQDQPAYWTSNRKRKLHKNGFDMIGSLNAKYIVLQGPVFSLALEPAWIDSMEKLAARGVRPIFLSSALFRHTEEELDAAKRFLERFPPAALSTRDTQTYEALAPYVDHAYDGICSAWFLPDAYTPPQMDTDAFVAVNFDRWPEPRIEFVDSTFSQSPESCLKHIVDNKVSLTTPDFLKYFSDKGKAWAYLGHALDRRKLPSTLGALQLLRTEHRTNPYFSWKVNQRSGAIAADEPFTYLTIYSNAQATYTDRVHACLAALAYGKPARLFTPSPRSRLFQRVGLDNIATEMSIVDQDLLAAAKTHQTKWFSDRFGSLQ